MGSVLCVVFFLGSSVVFPGNSVFCFSQLQSVMHSKETILFPSSLGNQGVYWGYFQDHGWEFTYRSYITQNDITQKPTSLLPETHKSRVPGVPCAVCRQLCRWGSLCPSTRSTAYAISGCSLVSLVLFMSFLSLVPVLCIWQASFFFQGEGNTTLCRKQLHNRFLLPWENKTNEGLTRLFALKTVWVILTIQY